MINDKKLKEFLELQGIELTQDEKNRIMAIFQKQEEMKKNSPHEKLLQNYRQSTDEQMIAARNAFRPVLNTLMNAYFPYGDKEKPFKTCLTGKTTPYSSDLIKIIFSNKDISQYFKSFVFDMKHKHNSNYEMTKNKNIHFPTTINSKTGGFIFRFFDIVQKAINKYHQQSLQNIDASEQVLESIFVPQIEQGCGCCNKNFYVSLDIENRTIVETAIEEELCPYMNQEGEEDNSYKARISFPSGKALLYHQSFGEVNKLIDFSTNHDLYQQHPIPRAGHITLNTMGGQRTIANLNAIARNIGIIFGSEGYKKIQKNKDGSILIGFDNKDQENYKESHFCTDYWAYSVMDETVAKEIFGPQYKKSNPIEFDIEPGTYDIQTIFYGDDYEKHLRNKTLKNKYARSNISQPEAVLKKVSDETYPMPFTEDELRKYIPIRPKNLINQIT